MQRTREVFSGGGLDKRLAPELRVLKVYSWQVAGGETPCGHVVAGTVFARAMRRHLFDFFAL